MIAHLLIAISAWILFSNGKLKNSYLAILVIQVSLNILWNITFFTYHSPEVSMIVMSLLMVSILINIDYFSGISKVAGYLLIPYLLWACVNFIINMMYLAFN